MSVFCTKCGSTSHLSYDCSAPDKKLVEPYVTVAVEPDQRAISDPGAKAEPSGGQSDPILLPSVAPGWPQVCSKENLPAFDDAPAAWKHLTKIAPSAVASAVWNCKQCGKVHFRVDSDLAKYPRTPFKPFLRKETAEAAKRVAKVDPDLPRREVKAAERKPEPPKLVQKLKPVQAKEMTLF
jgi:hypothetical protein